MLDVLSVVGTRPNFVKVGALHRAFSRHPEIRSRILHTGQHYDERMSDVFFRQLELPEPDIYLGVGSGTHAEQTGRVMMAFEKELQRERPDLVVVVGDVNSTLSCALVSAKLHVPVAHVEAGLRSGDRTMPEEINRLATDAISDYLFVSEQSGLDNLRREGATEERIFYVGNVMIDSLMRSRSAAAQAEALTKFGLEEGEYVLMTMHRPATVDDPEALATLSRLLRSLSASSPVVFPVHPRTRQRLQREGYADDLEGMSGLHLVEPLGYLEFLHLMDNAGVVVTDSGGVQEETTALGVPCITLRDSTERPSTVDIGTNILLPLDLPVVERRVGEALTGSWKKGEVPPLWDGSASERIAEVVSSLPINGRAS